MADRELAFLVDLRGQIAQTFDNPELAEQLFLMAAAELMAGPSGVTAWYERAQRAQGGKPIPQPTMPR